MFSQAPQKMSYQAVIRNSSNNLVTASPIGIQVSILQGSTSGTEVYREIYNPNPQANANGLVTLEIGSGTPLTGFFTSIDWAAGPYFIKTEIDPLGGSEYTITSVSELLSVPYALFAKTAENISGGIAEADPVFTNHASYGITPTNIANWNTAYSWGNHAGLYSLTEHSHPYLPLAGGVMGNTNIVTNLNADLLDGQNGSFYAPSSGSANYIQNQDTIDQNANIRINGNISSLNVNIPNTRSSKSGVINFGETPFIHNYHEIGVEGENIFIGYNSGNFTMGAKGGASNLASKNTAVGNNSLRINTTGSRNTAIGSDALFSNTTGYHNAAIGQGAMLHNTTGHYNTAVGMDALWDNTTGYYNVAVGRDALCHVTTGYQNIGIGVGSGFHLGSGIQNVIVGDFAMYENTNGNGNVAIGKFAMRNNLSGSNNTVVGQSGMNFNTQGTGNVVIGSEAGYYETGSNRLFIDNHHRGSEVLGRTNSLIYGVFDTNISNQFIRINGKIGIGISPVARLDIAGSSEYAVNASMIARFKGSGTHGLGISVTGKDTWLQSGHLGFYNYDVTNILLNPMGGSIFIGYTLDPTSNNKLAVNGAGYFSGGLDATSYRISGVSTFLNWARTGFAGTAGQVLTSQGASTTPFWRSLADAGIAPSSGSANYIQNQNASAQTANMWISGAGIFQGGLTTYGSFDLTGKQLLRAGQIQSNVASGTAPLTVASSTVVTNLNADLLDGLHGSFYAPASVYPATGLTTGFVPYKTSTVLANSPIRTDGVKIGIGISPVARLDIAGSSEYAVNASMIARFKGSGTHGLGISVTGKDTWLQAGHLGHYNYDVTNILLNPMGGSIFIGYTSDPSFNSKLAVNGNIFTNGTITATGGNSSNWNTSFSWGNHVGLYRPKNYVPDWSEITSNPFAFSSVSNNQLLKYNSTTLKWENWTPNFLTSYTESDPNFAAWNKTSGIIITASQVSDFQTSVSNNSDVIENSAKNSYPSTDATKLAGIESGAEVNVNADWNATGGDAQILNKPTISVGTNPGDMQYWDGTQWVIIAAGQPGQFLQFTASNKPEWITVSPIINTTGVLDITNTSAIISGNIISNAGAAIVARGVCWSTSPNPTTADNKTFDGTASGFFTSSISGLTNATIYYVRAYITSTSYTAYGNELSFISGE